MAVINAVGNALTGSTGSGAFVGANTPTLITPIIGVASGTSLSFGSSALSFYEVSSAIVPTVTFATPGDLNVSYSSRSLSYIRIGDFVFFSYAMNFTPTYTTASGEIRFEGLPFTIGRTTAGQLAAKTAGMAFPAGTTMVVALMGNGVTYVNLRGIGTGVATANLSVTEFPSATARSVTFNGCYTI
jgi:hypothetical protein